MKNVISLLAITIMTTSCVNLSGSLDVTKTLTAKKRGGFLNLQMKTVKIEPGIYSSNLKVNSKSSFTLKLNSKNEEENDILIPIKSVEENFNIPSNGPISIKGETISQPFDLKGDIATSYSESDKTSAEEACTFTVQERRCEKVTYNVPAPTKENPKATVERHEIVCGMKPISYNGHRFVEYHQLYTTRVLKAEILAEKSDEVLATLNASGTESDRINDFVGECR